MKISFTLFLLLIILQCTGSFLFISSGSIPIRFNLLPDSFLLVQESIVLDSLSIRGDLMDIMFVYDILNK